MVRHLSGKTSLSYYSWKGARQRCFNPKFPGYENYGGRGITMCMQWSTFEVFFSDMGERPKGMTLDRRDNNLNYTPCNCQWATYKQQNRNQRSNRIISINGVSRCVAEWCEINGISRLTAGVRLTRGWSEEDAVTLPPMFVRATTF